LSEVFENGAFGRRFYLVQGAYDPGELSWIGQMDNVGLRVVYELTTPTTAPARSKRA
jgi:hypothetical protein